ncbi:helix-turn-helix domain-containing protein [Nonomuraea sp. NPDC050394]|uniref:helix-turn-helix domain-containing protein n=1 Tax=Nonomuraea sp. NPDC050394 TaxID=3364363 RepID=UPI0037B8AE78
MVGGRARSRSPRDLAQDPENWPHADLSGHVAAAVVQAIAASLRAVMEERGLSFRRLAELSGVNRQTVNDVAVGRCWPDVATIAQLEAGLSVRLWPVPARRILRNLTRGGHAFALVRASLILPTRPSQR